MSRFRAEINQQYGGKYEVVIFHNGQRVTWASMNTEFEAMKFAVDKLREMSNELATMANHLEKKHT